jgi:hypothetical protein
MTNTMLIDPATNIIVSILKLARVLTLWISVYFTQKIYQDKFVQSVYYNKGSSNKVTKQPPNIQYFIFVVMLIDLITYGLLLLTIFSSSHYIIATTEMGSVFTVDGQVAKTVIIDYAISSVIILLIGVLLSRTIRNQRHLRYNDLGVRGIRAFSELILMIAIIITLLPFYRFF